MKIFCNRCLLYKEETSTLERGMDCRERLNWKGTGLELFSVIWYIDGWIKFCSEHLLLVLVSWGILWEGQGPPSSQYSPIIFLQCVKCVSYPYLVKSSVYWMCLCIVAELCFSNWLLHYLVHLQLIHECSIGNIVYRVSWKAW